MSKKPLDRKITTRGIYMGYTWREAIEDAMRHPDCGIEAVYVYTNPESLSDDTSVFSHYQLYGFGNMRKYIRKIPAQLNALVEKMAKELHYKIRKIIR